MRQTTPAIGDRRRQVFITAMKLEYMFRDAAFRREAWVE